MIIFRSEAPRPGGFGARQALVAALLFALSIAAMRLLLSYRFDDAPQPTSLARAAELPVTLPDGRTAALGKLLRPGIPTVIALWASWCGPCVKEAPALASLRQRYGPTQLNFVYLNVREPGGDRDALTRHLRTLGLPDDYAIMGDSQLVQLTNDLTNAIPRLYMFRADGSPAAMIIGYKPLALSRIAGMVEA